MIVTLVLVFLLGALWGSVLEGRSCDKELEELRRQLREVR